MPIKIDRNKIPRTYREHLEKLKSMGEMREIDDEVDWDLEQGAIVRRAYEECLPGPIFNKVKDCPKGSAQRASATPRAVPRVSHGAGRLLC